MAPRKFEPQVAQGVSFTPTKVKKRTTIPQPSQIYSGPIIEPSTSYSVKRYANGPVNLEGPPSHLVPM